MLWRALGYAVEVLRDHDRRNGEHHGELRDSPRRDPSCGWTFWFLPEGPRISDHDRRAPTGCKRPNEAKQQCPNRVKKHTSSSNCSTCALPREFTAIKLNQQS